MAAPPTLALSNPSCVLSSLELFVEFYVPAVVNRNAIAVKHGHAAWSDDFSTADAAAVIMARSKLCAVTAAGCLPILAPTAVELLADAILHAISDNPDPERVEAVDTSGVSLQELLDEQALVPAHQEEQMGDQLVLAPGLMDTLAEAEAVSADTELSLCAVAQHLGATTDEVAALAPSAKELFDTLDADGPEETPESPLDMVPLDHNGIKLLVQRHGGGPALGMLTVAQSVQSAGSDGQHKLTMECRIESMTSVTGA